MNYFIGDEFLESLSVLHKLGQSFSTPYKKAFKAYRLVNEKKEYEQVFSKLPKTNHGEKRINHAIKYDLGRACRLVTWVHKNKCGLLYAGTHDVVEKWLDKNRGFTLVRENKTKQIKILHKSDKNNSNQYPQVDINPDGYVLIDNLNDKQKAIIYQNLDGPTAIKVSKLRSIDNDDIILDAIEQLPEPTFGIVCNILLLLRSIKNDNEIARLIYDLNGELTPVEDITNEEFMSSNESNEVIIRINKIDIDFVKKSIESENYQKWMVFMHPEQEQIVEKNYNGPALLQGVSGSGKTAIVVNRAIRLARQNNNKKIVVITLNKALAKLIEDLVVSVAGEMPNLTVNTFWEICKEQLLLFEPGQHHHFDEITWKSKEDIDEIWQEFYHQEENNSDSMVLFPVHKSILARNVYPSEYIKEEFDFIRSAFAKNNRAEYLNIDREGRHISLPKDYREMILKGLSFWEDKMKLVGSQDYSGVATALYEHIKEIKPIYDSIVVDEMQDMGTLELEIIRSLAKKGENDIFLAGDTVQRVHTKQHNFTKAGINIKGRSMKIMQNYRNTKEILQAATNILEENLTGMDFATQEIEFLPPSFASASDYVPYMLEGDDLSAELTYAIQYMQEQIKESNSGLTGCIAVAGYHLSDLKELAELMKITLLNGDIDLKNKKIFLSDLEQTKGFEFDHMIIVGCSAGVLPNPNLPEEEAFRDLSRFYVAMTRARKNLIISHSGEVSKFMKNSEEYFLEDKWKEQLNLNDKLKVEIPFVPGSRERYEFSVDDKYFEKRVLRKLPAKDFLLTRAAIGLSKTRQDRLLKYITGKRGVSKSIQNNTWLNISELLKESRVNYNRILAGQSNNVKEEVEYFRELFKIPDKQNIQKDNNETSEVFNGFAKAAEAFNNSNHEDQEEDNVITQNKWSVILEHSGECMHCGSPSIPGDYVCYQCNPG